VTVRLQTGYKESRLTPNHSLVAPSPTHTHTSLLTSSYCCRLSTVRIMAGYLTCLTWVLLLALCYTPTPAHSGSFGSAGIGGGGGIHDGPWLGADEYLGGSNADSTVSGVILRTCQTSDMRVLHSTQDPKSNRHDQQS
ncbi:hypothetical protein Hamer_G014910, partial [Homarus americanus]